MSTATMPLENKDEPVAVQDRDPEPRLGTKRRSRGGCVTCKEKHVRETLAVCNTKGDAAR